MKKYILILAAVVFTSVAYSQKNKVVSAYNYNKAFARSGKCKELASGVEAINLAIEHDQTKSWAKTWYYRGNLYYNIIASKNAECKAIAADALEKCADSYLKALVLNFDDPELKKLDLQKEDGSDMMMFFTALQSRPKVDDETYTADIMGRKFPGLAGEYANEGIDKFKKDDYKGAQESFGKSMLLNQMGGKMDTMVMYNMALASEYAKDFDAAKQLYDALIMLKYNVDEKGPVLYSSIAKIYRNEGDTTKAIEYLQKGRIAYPTNQGLILEEVDYFLKSNKHQEAIDNLDAALKNDANNAFIYYVRGNMYDKLEQKEKAVLDYKKSIELDSNQHDALYNLGAYYYNKGVEKLKEADELPISQKKKYDAFKLSAKKHFEEGIPFVKNAHKAKPGDTGTGNMLIKLYTHTGQYDKAKEIKAKFQ